MTMGYGAAKKRTSCFVASEAGWVQAADRVAKSFRHPLLTLLIWVTCNPALAGGGPNAIRSIEWREFLTLFGWHGCDVAGTHEGAVARDAADRLAWQVFRGFVGCRGERRLRGHTHDVSKEISHAIPGLTHKSR